MSLFNGDMDFMDIVSFAYISSPPLYSFLGAKLAFLNIFQGFWFLLVLKFVMPLKVAEYSSLVSCQVIFLFLEPN